MHISYFTDRYKGSLTDLLRPNLRSLRILSLTQSTPLQSLPHLHHSHLGLYIYKAQSYHVSPLLRNGLISNESSAQSTFRPSLSQVPSTSPRFLPNRDAIPNHALCNLISKFSLLRLPPPTLTQVSTYPKLSLCSDTHIQSCFRVNSLNFFRVSEQTSSYLCTFWSTWHNAQPKVDVWHKIKLN